MAPPNSHVTGTQGTGIVFRVEPRVVTGNLWATDFRDPDGHLLSIFGPASQPQP